MFQEAHVHGVFVGADFGHDGMAGIHSATRQRSGRGLVSARWKLPVRRFGGHLTGIHAAVEVPVPPPLRAGQRIQPELSASRRSYSLRRSQLAKHRLAQTSRLPPGWSRALARTAAAIRSRAGAGPILPIWPCAGRQIGIHVGQKLGKRLRVPLGIVELALPHCVWQSSSCSRSVSRIALRPADVDVIKQTQARCDGSMQCRGAPGEHAGPRKPVLQACGARPFAGQGTQKSSTAAVVCRSAHGDDADRGACHRERRPALCIGDALRCRCIDLPRQCWTRSYWLSMMNWVRSIRSSTGHPWAAMMLRTVASWHPAADAS